MYVCIIIFYLMFTFFLHIKLIKNDNEYIYNVTKDFCFK